MRRLYLIKVILLIFLSISQYTYAQKGQDQRKQLDKADKLFRVRNYENALPIYLEVIKSDANNPALNYKIAQCYAQKEGIADQVKSVPFFEKAIKSKDQSIPKAAHLQLARMYHKNSQISEAIESLEKYKSGIDTYDKRALKEVNRELKVYKNALFTIGNPKDIVVKSVSDIINSDYTEYNPVVSTDQSVMAFTSLKPNTDKLRENQNYMEEIYVSYRNIGGKWSEPKHIPIKSQYNVGTAGISPDGQKMLIFVGSSNNTGNIFQINREGENSWSQPVPLERGLNSNYLESTASITPDGKTMYFASNRPGGYGGLDIYKSEKQSNNTWSKPKNMGPTINSKNDEEAPYIHPDGKTLFFTSNGPNSIGGNDIFKTVYIAKKWQEPVNMGFPINTTANDNYFTLTADGGVGYFSSDRIGGKGGQDIYYIDMPESERNIPLTLIKGRILAGESMKPVPTVIKVINNETKEKIDYVYSPNPKTGDYLIIFPPGKSYDMVIESEGFLPYTINIDVPNQNYFYELYQKIILKPITQFGVIVGQEIDIKNAFFDTKQGAKVEPRKANEAMLVSNDSIDLYEIMDGIIGSADTTAFEYLLDLMYTVNPIDAVDFEDENAPIESASRIYYYDETDKSKLEEKVIEGKTIYSLPTMFVTKLAKEQKNKKQVKSSPEFDKKVLAMLSKVYFDVGKSELKSSYHHELDKILEVLKQYNNLGLEISGYASSEGDADKNRELSDKRAIGILDYFNKKGIVRRRIIAKGYGATSNDENLSKVEARCVEVRVVDMNAL